MEPISTAVLSTTVAQLLSKFLVKSAETAGKEAGTIAWKKAEELFGLVTNRLTGDSIAEAKLFEFTRNPRSPEANREVESTLSRIVDHDPDFKKELTDALAASIKAGSHTMFDTNITGSVQQLAQFNVVNGPVTFGDVVRAPDIDTRVEGNVAKLVNVAHVAGNLVVLNDSAIRQSLEEKKRDWGFIDVTKPIEIFVVSKRFGRKVQLKIPDEMKAGALITVLVELLQLPTTVRVQELQLEFFFTYRLIHSSAIIDSSLSLKTAGVRNNNEIEMDIQFGWRDPTIGEEGSKSAGSGGGGGGGRLGRVVYYPIK